MERKDNSGALFKVDEVKSEKHPVYTGRALIDGKDKYISAWVNTSKKGMKYMSLKFEKPKPKEDSKPKDEYFTSTATPSPVKEEEVPF